MNTSSRVIQFVSRQVGLRHSSHGHGHVAPHTTYNDLPMPSGSWQTNYDAQQRKFNALLALGVGALTGTIIFGKAIGFFEFYNDYPARPADIQSYKEDKEED